MSDTLQNPETEKETFVETALKLSGKSEEEARTTGAIDRADEQVEALFAKKYQTVGSPAHLAVWDAQFPTQLFMPTKQDVDPEIKQHMDQALQTVRQRLSEGTLYDENHKINPESFAELAQTKYWGMLVDRQYGGLEVPFAQFAKFLTKMATIEPTVAGLASVHGCIGAVDPIRNFGNAEQKAKYLPKLASGERLSAFALTEPGAGSDLTALKTTAQLDGDHYVVNGEKLFITNAIPGRTIGLVCLIENKPAVLITDLPDQENEHFQLVHYGLYALKQAHNKGLKFKNFRVPRENLLQPSRGNGLTIAYHGLNRGRVALCATAAGTMRVMLASMLPWAHFRRTYGESIVTRELVQRRIGHLAGLIVGCDALVEWCSWLLDQGFRGEMECIIAKIFGSESQKEAAIELYMKTHGGRAFLHGHYFGDNIHEFLAPCIYEGEGEMLGMAFFKSLVKEHGSQYFEPIGRALKAAGIQKPNPLNPGHAWALKSAVMPYLKWRVKQTISGASSASFPAMPQQLKEHAQFAADQLQKSRFMVDDAMRKYQLSLTDRQCTISQLSDKIQKLLVMLTTALWAGQQEDPLIQMSADVLCQDLKQKFQGKSASAAYFKAATKLGAAIAEGEFQALENIQPHEILMPYEN